MAATKHTACSAIYGIELLPWKLHTQIFFLPDSVHDLCLHQFPCFKWMSLRVWFATSSGPMVEIQMSLTSNHWQCCLQFIWPRGHEQGCTTCDFKLDAVHLVVHEGPSDAFSYACQPMTAKPGGAKLLAGQNLFGGLCLVWWVTGQMLSVVSLASIFSCVQWDKQWLTTLGLLRWHGGKQN